MTPMLQILAWTLVLALVQIFLPATVKTIQYGAKWNAGPRDAKGRRGPYEEALIGTPVADAERPLEILRTVHSFDPCMACGVHVVDATRRTLASGRVG